MERAFHERGLPNAIRSDNGAPPPLALDYAASRRSKRRAERYGPTTDKR